MATGVVVVARGVIVVARGVVVVARCVVMVVVVVTRVVASAVVWMGAGHSKFTACNPPAHWIQVVISKPSSAYPDGQ